MIKVEDGILRIEIPMNEFMTNKVGTLKVAKCSASCEFGDLRFSLRNITLHTKSVAEREAKVRRYEVNALRREAKDAFREGDFEKVQQLSQELIKLSKIA